MSSFIAPCLTIAWLLVLRAYSISAGDPDAGGGATGICASCSQMRHDLHPAGSGEPNCAPCQVAMPFVM